MEPLKVSDILKLKQGDTLKLFQRNASAYFYRYKHPGILHEYIFGRFANISKFDVQFGKVWYSIKDGYIYEKGGKKIAKINEIDPESPLGFYHQPFYINPSMRSKL